MHDYSLPKSDRLDAGVPAPKPVRHPARVLALADGNAYFRAFRRGGRLLTTKSIRFAALFGPSADASLEKTRRKLKRLGIVAKIVEVRLIVSSTP